jgi:predicted DNA-binding transcriptional regulator AlpA
VDHWKTAGVLQSSENSLYTHIRKLALAPPQKIKIGNPVGFQIIEIQNVTIL